MEERYQYWGDVWQYRGAWSWAVLASLLVHGLFVAVVVAVFQESPSRPRMVVPVEVVSLVPFKPGPAGGGGGRPAPATKPESVAPKPSQPPAPPKPSAKPPKPSKIKLAPPPLSEPSIAPVIPTPAPPAAITRAKPSDTAITSSRANGPVPGGLSGTGEGGQGGGRGTGAGGGIGQGQGPGSGAGSALQGYLQEVRRLLEKQKDYPFMARSRQLQGVVVLGFTIAAGGEIESYGVSRSSGQDLLDEAAKETIRKVGHFPPFPADLNRQKLSIEVPLAFRLSND